MIKSQKKLLNIFQKENQKGSLLTELMIGLLISVLTVMVVIFVFTQFEEHKKTTTEVSQTIANNALSVFPLQTYAKMAGYGFNDKTFYGCSVKSYNSTTGTTSTYTLRPVNIETNVNGTTNDRVTFMLSSSNNFYSTLKIMNSMSTATDTILVNSRFGVRLGDVLLLNEPGKDCSLIQVTNLPTDTGRTSEIIFTGTSYSNNGVNVPATFNKTGAHSVLYSSSAEVANFGRDGKRISFSIEDGNFVENNFFVGTDNKTTLGSNVVAFKAIYGLDTDRDGNVDSWTNVTPANEDLDQIIGVRYVLISRSPSPSGSVCNVTQNSVFSWFGGEIDVSDSMGDDWGCYRYRMIQGTAPLKNMIWTK